MYQHNSSHAVGYDACFGWHNQGYFTSWNKLLVRGKNLCSACPNLQVCPDKVTFFQHNVAVPQRVDDRAHAVFMFSHASRAQEKDTSARVGELLNEQTSLSLKCDELNMALEQATAASKVVHAPRLLFKHQNHHFIPAD